MPAASIDQAVMERAERIAVVPCDPSWSDLGSWQTLWEQLPKDASGNAIAEFGEKLTYGFTVTNNGNVPLSNVTLTDSKLGLDKVACVASLAVGASTTCPLLTVPSYTVTDDDIDDQTIDNTATAAGTFGSGASATTVSDTKKVSLATEADKPAITLNGCPPTSL